MQSMKSDSRAPVLVHCSAGIGRTGVYIMLELGLAHFQAHTSFDMTAVLTDLRSQRMGMVQTEVWHARHHEFDNYFETSDHIWSSSRF